PWRAFRGSCLRALPPSAVVLRSPPCGRLLPARGARRRGGPRPAHDRRDREHPQRTRGRRIVAAGPSPRWRRAVPRRCSARSAVETGDIPRLQNPRMVGRSTSVPAFLSGNLGTPQSRARPRRHDGVITPAKEGQLMARVPEPDQTPEGPAYEGRLLDRPDEEVVDQGASFDLRTLFSRRGVLGLIGAGVGAAALTACSSGTSGSASSSSG